jgi:hypothetical protein
MNKPEQSVIYQSWIRRLPGDNPRKISSKLTKEMAEVELNERDPAFMPVELMVPLTNHVKGITPKALRTGTQPFKWGKLLRKYYPRLFNQWFLNTYVPAKLKAAATIP